MAEAAGGSWWLRLRPQSAPGGLACWGGVEQQAGNATSSLPNVLLRARESRAAKCKTIAFTVALLVILGARSRGVASARVLHGLSFVAAGGGARPSIPGQRVSALRPRVDLLWSLQKREVGTERSLRPLPTQNILWFCELLQKGGTPRSTSGCVLAWM